jgi:hypothetical protein
MTTLIPLCPTPLLAVLIQFRPFDCHPMALALIYGWLQELLGNITRHVAWSGSPQSQSPLLELPADVVALVVTFLSPSDKLSAALVCKPLRSICKRNLHKITKHVCKKDKEDFLLRLERDLMATHIYCAVCTRLHRISSLNKPNEPPPFSGAPICLGIDYKNSPTFSENHFAYHHGRAAMNHHFYGAPAGIDPESLRYKTLFKDINLILGYHVWFGRYSVKIISDNLFLFGENVMESRDVRSMTRKLNAGSFDICPHTTTSAISNRMLCSTRAVGLSEGDIFRFLQEPGRVVHGSCARCLTDYTVEISRRSRSPGPVVSFRVKIKTWTDFGQFRSPQDWKWRAWRRKAGEYYLVTPRNLKTYPPGSVFKRYRPVEEQEESERFEASA